VIHSAIILLLASLAGSAGSSSGEIVCESRRIPVKIAGGGARSVYVIEHETRCFHPPLGHLEKLKLTCDVLVSAYGEDEGRARCQELISRSGIPAIER